MQACSKAFESAKRSSFILSVCMIILYILYKHQGAISINKYDSDLAKKLMHKVHLKTKDSVYRKHFKTPEAHHQFIEQTLDEWLKLRVVN
jgi:hypothetical protein